MPSPIDSIIVDPRIRHLLADLPTTYAQAACVLKIASDNAVLGPFSLEEIEAMFHHVGLTAKRDTLRKALESKPRNILKKGSVYSLATLGGRDATTLLQDGDITVQFCDGNTPRTSRRTLRELLGGLSGTIRICDPYYGVRILDSIEAIPSTSEVLFLTQATGEDPVRLAGTMRDYLREYPLTSFKIYPPRITLHDRYILSDDRLMIIGHGLKDIGWKESFILHFEQSELPDLHSTLRGAFDAHWQQAIDLTF